MKIKIFLHKKKNGDTFVSKKDLRRLQKFLQFGENIKEVVEIEYTPDKFMPK